MLPPELVRVVLHDKFVEEVLFVCVSEGHSTRSYHKKHHSECKHISVFRLVRLHLFDLWGHIASRSNKQALKACVHMPSDWH